jgi:hypothetical protein
MTDTTTTEDFDLPSVWKEVQEVQAQATEGLLKKEDVERALDLYEEYAPRHPSCKVRAAASGADRRLTAMEISDGDVEITRKTTAHHYSTRTGISVEFDYYADDERELHEELKDEGFRAHSKRKIFEESAGTNEVQHDVDLSNEPSEETLVSLFKINKHARKYADEAQHHYNRQKHDSAGRTAREKKRCTRSDRPCFRKLPARPIRLSSTSLMEKVSLPLFWGVLLSRRGIRTESLVGRLRYQRAGDPR